MNRAAQALAGLVAVFRNENLRRLELGWGAAITAEWAHFVALGVFAYDAGGAVGVGIAGLVRMLPAALVAPFAASLGDRFRRERFLVSIALSAPRRSRPRRCLLRERNTPAIFALAAVMGLSATLVRPAQQALLPSLARTPEELIGSNGATSTIESLGTLVGPLLAGVLVSVADAGVVFAVGAGALLLGAPLLPRQGRGPAVAPPARPGRSARTACFWRALHTSHGRRRREWWSGSSAHRPSFGVV